MVASQIKSTAKKIKASSPSMDNKGYLTITLPEKDFSLPMYKTGGKVLGSLGRIRGHT